ncbi:hypothetical protein [Marivirga sp.]|uniref:hypothetical protein n=1 Tax=Marivirga sp. TaxID=2018662 RepID=UPI002D7FDCA1|nr:hypothetical protein [Marivirga sp.]HET8860804.1 hypothetical protein [Marivirga sp.]
MKNSYYFLFLFILPFFTSCQNDETIAEVENSHNELINFLGTELGDIEGKTIYLIPTSLGDELLHRLMIWSDLVKDANSKIVIVGEVNKNHREFVNIFTHQYGEIYQTKSQYDLINSAQKIEIMNGTITSRIEYEKMEFINN